MGKGFGELHSQVKPGVHEPRQRVQGAHLLPGAAPPLLKIVLPKEVSVNEISGIVQWNYCKQHPK